MRFNVNGAARCWLLAVLVLVSACQDPASGPTATAPSDPESAATETQEKSSAKVPSDEPPGDTQAPGKTAALTNLTEAEINEGWIALFDGKSLFGWQANSDADWRVEDGAIVVSQGEKGLLLTTSQFSNYVLKLQFRSDAKTNSGIFLHTPRQPQNPGSDCYELNIADQDNPFPTGSLVQRAKVEGNFDSQDWQSYQVTVQGAQVTVELDGQEVLRYTDPHPLRRGHIGLQLNEGRVAFRDIQLKPLDLEPLLNGRNLDGWRTYPEMASKFEVTEEGWLHVRDGRGQLETEELFGDFVLQLQCKTHARHLNSGIFFRCIPGEQMNGYESQIHNGFQDGDRSKPIDCGTGGIFRRQDARLVVADDLQWFSKTMVVDGPHVAVWVNGYQVSDWTDSRDPDPNPRRGLRIEPGSIMIQGHDPTTDLSFRDLRAAELPPRQQPPP